MSQWIRTKNKMPETFKTVFVYSERAKEMFLAYFTGKVWFSSGTMIAKTSVTHWMEVDIKPPETDEMECQTHKKTNADKIRNLTDEELDMFLRSVKNRARLIALGNKPELMRELVSLDWLKEECKD